MYTDTANRIFFVTFKSPECICIITCCRVQISRKYVHHGKFPQAAMNLLQPTLQQMLGPAEFTA